MVIYLDHAATTPMSPDVLAAYVSALAVVGNPSSIHSQGQDARRMLEEARETVASLVGADPIEVVFTSGGTEAVNLAIKGLFWARQEPGARSPACRRPRILLTGAEHHATLDSVRWLAEHEGAVLEWIPVTPLGHMSLPALAAALDGEDDVALVTTLWANNEVGTTQPIAEIAAAAAARGIPVHSDAIAALGQVPIDFAASGLAALSVSAHKIGGPVGVGALVVSRTASLTPLIHGGDQQRIRAGTQNVAGAVAFAAAASAAGRWLESAAGRERLVELRNRLIAGVLSTVPHAVLHGDRWLRLPGNAHFTFEGCEGDSLLFLLDAAGFSVSTGSACRAGVTEASHVLIAMGMSEPDAHGALRISLGPDSTTDEVDALVAALPRVVAQAQAAGFAARPRVPFA